MDISQHIVFLIEIIGTIAFASSGTMVAIEKKLDLFGVIILGLSTAVGGGMIRDLILGIHPPMMFQNSIYVKISVIVSVIIFLIVYWNNQILNSKYMKRYTFVMNLFDAIGLGAFTVIGIHTAYDVGYNSRNDDRSRRRNGSRCVSRTDSYRIKKTYLCKCKFCRCYCLYYHDTK